MQDQKVPVVMEDITREAFKPYGDVIEHSDMVQANQGTAYRQNWQTQVQSINRPHDKEVGLNVCTFNCQSRKLPLDLNLLERHPYSSQLFQPVTDSDYLVVVALDSANGPIEVKAFRVKNQGINYKANTWHHPMINLKDQPQVFLCLVNEQKDGKGGLEDCEEVSIQITVNEQ